MLVLGLQRLLALELLPLVQLQYVELLRKLDVQQLMLHGEKLLMKYRLLIGCKLLQKLQFVLTTLLLMLQVQPFFRFFDFLLILFQIFCFQPLLYLKFERLINLCLQIPFC